MGYGPPELAMALRVGAEINALDRRFPTLAHALHARGRAIRVADNAATGQMH